MTRDENGDAQGGPDTSLEARRARKRATDRKSQREHRERTKQHVSALEHEIKILRSVCADGSMKELLADKDRLREENNKLKADLNRIRAIVADSYAVTSTSTSTVTSTSTSTAITTATATVSSGSPLTFGRTYASTSTKAEDFPEVATESLLLSTPLPPLMPEAFRNHGQLKLAGPVLGGGMASHIPVDLLNPTARGILSPLSVGQAGLLGVGSTGLSQGQIPPPMHPVGLMPHQPKPLNEVPVMTRTLEPTAPGPHTIPLHCEPLNAGDQYILAMLQEARSDYEHGRFRSDTPTLSQILSSNPYDRLSWRIYHFLKQYGGMPLHTMMAVLWCHYVFLRTREAYVLIPEFFRPTQLQCQVPHSILIDVLCWPHIRDKLIENPVRYDVLTVSIELLCNLNPNWNPKEEGLDIWLLIERECYDFDFWKLGPSFARENPQLVHLTHWP